MQKYYISVGSNLPDKIQRVKSGIKRLNELFPKGFDASDLYETQCVGGSGPGYANAVVSFTSDVGIDELTTTLKMIEVEFDRSHDDKRSVALDLDVVIAGDDILRQKDFERNYFQIGYQSLKHKNDNPKNIFIKDFVYDLPEDRIASHPLVERDQCKLLIADSRRIINDDIFKNITDYIDSESILIYNNTKVINARLRFRKESGAVIEIFCLEPELPADYQLNFASTNGVSWKCFVGNSKRWKNGSLKLPIYIDGKEIELKAERINKNEGDSIIEFTWNDSSLTFAQVIEGAGEIPIPPYLNRSTEESDKTDYQTIFSRIEGSVAAPTAGLHFTPEVLKDIDNKGILRREVTLHVGAGTFQPVKSETVGEHQMHSEFIEVSRELINELAETKRTVIAVGTTSVRTLESLYHIGCLVHIGQWTGSLEQWYPYSPAHPKLDVKDSLKALASWLNASNADRLVASTGIIIAPGYEYKIVSRMVTNFHQPGSTLLLLVSAMIGDKWKEYYTYALDNDYRFLSYGDACLFSGTTSAKR